MRNMTQLKSYSVRSSRRRGHGRKGIALIWMAIFLVLIISIVGLATDAAFVALTAHQLQNAADAASLGGAVWVRVDLVEAHNAAIDLAFANKAAGDPVRLTPNPNNEPTGDVVIGRYNSTDDTFVATLTGANAVKAVARRTEKSLGGPLELLFGRVIPLLFGADAATASLTRDAIAQFLIPQEDWSQTTFRLDGREHLRRVQVTETRVSAYSVLVGGAS